MSGTAIIGALLLADTSVTAAVPAGQLKAGRLPDDAPLPALLVRTISSTDMQLLKPGSTRRTTDRVSVTVRAASYRELGEILRLVRDACADRTGDIGGGKRVSILTAGGGPDLNGPANSFERTQDFRVSFDADA